MGDFKRAHAFVKKWEGGFDDHPADPGGVTNYGVSLAYLRDHKLIDGDLNGDGVIDRKDILAMTPEKAAELFKKDFWDSNNLDTVPDRVAIVAYDTGVNMGVGYARKLVQQALGVTVDGVWGPKTRAALSACSDLITAQNMIELRQERYLGIVSKRPASRVFLKGWLNRLAALRVEVSK